MTISDNNKKFLEDLIQYYISEAESYMQIADQFNEVTNSKPATAFGIIVGTVYSRFMQSY